MTTSSIAPSHARLRRRAASFTVALVGGDGAGKTTVSRALRKELPFPTRTVYLGANPAAATHLLPTTRLVRAVRRARGSVELGDFPDLSRVAEQRPSLRARAHEAVWIAHRIVEEWYRQLVVWVFLRRGYVVVLDRHYYADYHRAGPGTERRSAMRRLHAALLAKVYPRPDLVVFLDAPPEVLLSRKGEGTLEYLDARRRDYLALEGWAGAFETVDAGRPLPIVVADVVAVVKEFARARERRSEMPH